MKLVKTNLIENSYENRLHALLTLTSFVQQYYGEECPDYEKGCPVCEQYAAIDTLARALALSVDD